METTIENIKEVSTETDIHIIRSLANKFNIKHVGVKKTELVEKINGKLEEENGMENLTIERSEELTNEGVQNPVAENQEVANAVVVEDQENATSENAASEATDTNKGKKWFEQEGTSYVFEEGQKIKITGGYEPLIGRFASIVQPSKKRDAVKARLFKPNKPSELQDTMVTFDIGNFELFEGEVPVIENKRKKAEVAVVAKDQTENEKVQDQEDSTPESAEGNEAV